MGRFDIDSGPSLSELMTQRAMQQAQLGVIGQESQLRNLQMQGAMDDRAQKGRLRDLYNQLPEGTDPATLIPHLIRAGDMQGAKQLYDLTQKENDNVVVGRSLMNKKSGNIVGTDSTWADEQKAGREAKMQELQIRLQDNATSRADRLAMQREMMGMRMDQQRESMALRRDTIAQGNKPPSGYRYTRDGNLEQIPGGPADLKTQIRMEGGGTVDSVVAGLRDMYGQLNESGGITDPKKSSLANLSAGISSSGIGQTAGRMLGTENQSRRNTIAQTRPLLLQAIMKATGMSAKQMDSNAELKLYLATATDPTLDVAANNRALDQIEKLYGSGSNKTKPAAPSVDSLLDKYK